METCRHTSSQARSDIITKSRQNRVFFSLATRGLCTENLSHLIRLSIINFISTSWIAETPVCRTRAELFSDNWNLHHDNTPSNVALSSRSFWQNNRSRPLNNALAHLLTPCNSFLFSMMGHHLKWSHSEAMEEIQKFATRTILKRWQGNDFWKCFGSRKQSRSSRTRTAAGRNCEYSEGEHRSSEWNVIQCYLSRYFNVRPYILKSLLSLCLGKYCKTNSFSLTLKIRTASKHSRILMYGH
jgi:hypothetical protein